MQGAKIAVVNSQDLIKILMIHAKMSCLRDAAGDTHVEVNSGGAAVVARAVQAATNPTEGQRMLQAGFDGEILGAESREKVSASSDVDGIKRVDRVVERSVVSEDGQAVLMQQVQQSAQQMPPTPDIEMATKTEFTALGTHVMLNMKNLLDLSMVTTKLWHKVDAIESKIIKKQPTVGVEKKVTNYWEMLPTELHVAILKIHHQETILFYTRGWIFMKTVSGWQRIEN